MAGVYCCCRCCQSWALSVGSSTGDFVASPQCLLDHSHAAQLVASLASLDPAMLKVTDLGQICRERAALMYANLPYISAVAFVELPYLLAQVIVFVPICYFLIGAHPVLPSSHLQLHGVLFFVPHHPGWHRERFQ